MKLIIQIPCWNEAEQLAATVADLPRRVKGVDDVEFLIIDDGSSDDTVKVAEASGVHHIIQIPYNMGLANAFRTGMDSCLRLGADIIVNTDADNQYCAKDIEKLVAPIVEKKVGMVIGVRPISQIENFSFLKKKLQNLGSYVVRKLSRTNVEDAPSGFRAFSRKAAQTINVFGQYSYTLETIIQCGQSGIPTVTVPVSVNKPTRESRLVKSIASYIRKSGMQMFRIFITYRPMRFFLTIASIWGAIGMLLCIRYLYFMATGSGDGHVQSVILGIFCLGLAFGSAGLGVLADLIAVNRKMLEKQQAHLWSLDERVSK